MIERCRTLSELRRKLQTFQIGADSLSSVIKLEFNIAFFLRHYILDKLFLFRC